MKAFTMSLAISLAGCASTMTGAQANAASPRIAFASDTSAAFGHYLSSIVLEKQGKIEEAVSELRKAADLAPEATAIQMKLLAVYYYNRNFEDALVMARRVVDHDPGNVRMIIWLGTIQYQLGQVEVATATFTRAIDLAPDDTMAYQGLAEVLENTNDLVGAIKLYERLVTMSPESDYLHYQLGLNLARIDEHAGATAALEKSVQLNPKLSAASLLLGVLYEQDKRFDLAVERFEAFLAENPGNVQAQVNLAGAEAQLGRFDKALAAMNAVLENEEAGPNHYLDRMYLWLRDGTLEDTSAAIAPTGAPYLGMIVQAMIRRRAGEPTGPLIRSLDALEGNLDQECNEYLNELLGTFGEEDTGAFLETEIRALTPADNRSAVVETVLARLFMSTDRWAEAEQALNGIIETFGGDKWAHYYCATVYEELDQPKETEKHLRACLEFDPGDPDVLNFLGYHLAEENTGLREAERLLVKALEIDPGNGFYLDSLGWIYYRLGRSKEAIAYIQRAIRQMSTDDAVLRDHLGDAFLLDGDAGKAVAEWERALRLDPKIEGVAGKLDKHRKSDGGE